MMPMPHVIDYYAATESVSSELGGTRRSYPDKPARVPAFVQPVSDSFAVVNETEGGNTMVNIYIPGEFNTDYYDRIFWDGAWYEVRGRVTGNGLFGAAYTRLTCGRNNQV